LNTREKRNVFSLDLNVPSAKNGVPVTKTLPCTPLCKCYGLGISTHSPDYRQVAHDDDSDSE